MTTDEGQITTILLRDEAGTTYAVPLAVLEGYALKPDQTEGLDGDVEGFMFTMPRCELVGMTSFTSNIDLQNALNPTDTQTYKADLLIDP